MQGSPDLNLMLSTIQTLVVLIMLGSVLKAFNIMPAEFAPMINRVVLTVTLPALVFRAIRSTAGKALGLESLKIPILAVLVILGCAGLGYVLANGVLHLDRRRTGAFLLAVMFGSTAFVGYPLFTTLTAEGGLSSEALFHHVFYSELGILVPLVTLGLVVASYYGEGRRFVVSDLLAIPRSAPFIAMLLGLLFYNDTLPPLVGKTVDTLADSTSFLMMFALGLTINWRDLTTYWRANLLAGGVRLVAAPILAFFLTRLLGMSDVMSRVAIIDSAMPAILLSLVYAAQFKLDVKFASTLVFTNFILSLPTLMFILLLTAQPAPVTPVPPPDLTPVPAITPAARRLPAPAAGWWSDRAPPSPVLLVPAPWPGAIPLGWAGPHGR
jgi:predicted permease